MFYILNARYTPHSFVKDRNRGQESKYFGKVKAGDILWKRHMQQDHFICNFQSLIIYFVKENSQSCQSYNLILMHFIRFSSQRLLFTATWHIL